MKTKYLLVAVLLSVTLPVLAAESSDRLDAQQADLTSTHCGDYDKLFNEMNSTYARILLEHKGDEVFVRKFKVAQQAWERYRNDYVNSIYPSENHFEAYGSVYPMCHCDALASVTKSRLADLKKWLGGFQDGDVCAGSRSK
jgi:uncharacterized protein YecT (DUF1311 family)